MKKGIHPQYNIIKVTCACGNEFEVGSTVDSINVEICSNCHPFYTGKQKLVDTAGMVDKFKERMEKAKQMQELREKGKKKAEKQEEPAKEDPKKSLKDLK